MPTTWGEIAGVMKTISLIVGSGGLLWKGFGALKTFTDAVTHSKAFMEQASKDLQELKGYASTAVENHMSHMQDAAIEVAHAYVSTERHLGTLTTELKDMNENMHARDLESARSNQMLIDAIGGLKDSVNELKRA